MKLGVAPQRLRRSWPAQMRRRADDSVPSLASLYTWHTQMTIDR